MREKVMKCRSASVVALGTVLSCGTQWALPAEIAIRVPDTVAARSATDLISRAGRAIRRYLDACEFEDAREPHDIVTNDARIEYALETPGAYLTLDASALFGGCTAAAASIGHRQALWIYPTGEKNVVFVQYDMSAAEHVAVIEMRGERILRMRDFGAAPVALLEVMRGSAQSELCTRLSQLGSVLAMTAPSPRLRPGQPSP
jgi:hypothetical protein